MVVIYNYTNDARIHERHVHYNLNNSLSDDPTPRQKNPVQAPPAYVLKLHYCDKITILPYTVSLKNGTFPSRFPSNAPHSFLFTFSTNLSEGYIPNTWAG